ncbi:AAC(3) family N-acetyltransferase [Paenibacillus hemerocallicola]|uniref:Aminoglycoside N(3)-acetyltransferase n=1 Tax=Paenibacillus hemerocallicola TaxID=1172614 RepID=A0A5C4T1L9_9BACL|nr:AAC(3) family N-acetyltransferase [Paenibacillus hemerocallicola]TNJ61999.1 AAC(3) family N-acetyltransferase [Paenibacillus hemerocallicola]
MTNKRDMLASLELMDIRQGDIVLVHSSLTSIGYVEGGAGAVVDALLEAVGPEGTIVMSTLTGWSEPFDEALTPSAVGKISETFRQRVDARRSLHPVHSVAAVGKHAEWITSGHERCDTGCGPETPYFKIKDMGGKVMLLGVDMDRNTIMHALEEAIDARYLRTVTIPAPTYIAGYGHKSFTLNKFPPGHRDFLRLTPVLRERDALVEGRIGNAAVLVMDVRAVFDIGLELLRDDPLFFICSNPNCNSCHWSRLLYAEEAIDYSMYHGNGCADRTCEICVVEN